MSDFSEIESLVEQIKLSELKIENYNFLIFVDELFSFYSSLSSSFSSKRKKQETYEFLLSYFNGIKPFVVFQLDNHFSFDGLSISKAYNVSYPNFVDSFFSLSLRRLAYMFDFNSSKEDFISIFDDLSDHIWLSNSFSCSKCDLYLNYMFDLKDLKIKLVYDLPEQVSPCLFKEEEYSISLSIPSKKLVFTNYFRNLLDDDKYESSSLNSYKGLVEHAKAYEKDNIGYIYVGNSSPSIFINSSKDNIIAANYHVLEEYYSYKQDNNLKYFFSNYNTTPSEIDFLENKLLGFSDAGSVCTDLWAVTFMDYDQFISLLHKNNFTEENYPEDFFVVDIASSLIEVSSNNIEFLNKDKRHFFSIISK